MSNSSEVVVTASFLPAEGKREELLELLSETVALVHEEEGCILYTLNEAPDGTILMIEKWESVELLDKHGSSPATLALKASVPALLGSPLVVTRLAPLPAGDAAKGAL